LAGDAFLLAEFIPVSEPIGVPGSGADESNAVTSPHGCCGGGSCGAPAVPSESECGDRRLENSSTGDTGRTSEGSADVDSPVLLFCPACSEAFSPEFFRLCAQCGHDFGEGREVAVPRSSEMNNRVLAALIALGTLAVAMLAYFWMLFR
jgi:hypothetical protein